MTRVLLDPNWRTMDELFSPGGQKALRAHDVIWGKDEKMPDGDLARALPQTEVLIAASPHVDQDVLDQAPDLQAVIEVSGAFPGTIDYPACAARGVEVLSCAPGFRSSVAEMGLAMTLAACRGLVREHEAFRTGTERWLDDCPGQDFTLRQAAVGFVGFGQIAREMCRLLAPFAPRILAYDPWLNQAEAQRHGIELVSLEDLAAQVRVLYVTAVPTNENRGLISRQVLSALADQSLVVVLSRAHLVDFAALTDEAMAGRLGVATDVFPEEPLEPDHPLRQCRGVVLSPHRAAAVPGGRHLIGDMILQDLSAISAGRPERDLARTPAERMTALAGVGDAKKVSALIKSAPND